MLSHPDGQLWHRILPDLGGGRFLSDAFRSVPLDALACASVLATPLEELRGHSVLVAPADQLTAALTLIELDGIVNRMTVCPADLEPEHLGTVAAEAGADIIVRDREAGRLESVGHLRPIFADASLFRSEVPRPRRPDRCTEWVLLTSGTTGVPKLVVHTLASLAGPIAPRRRPRTTGVWSTFYDIRRYGGLQIFLRALLEGGSLVLTSPSDPLVETLRRLTAAGVTFISGTPSHWRRVLMSGAAHGFAPDNVRLSGEIADQAVLDRLRVQFPQARIVHAFASTEAGVAFEVSDEREGFPAGIIGALDDRVEIKVAAGTLRIRSQRMASRYLGGDRFPADVQGFVDTGDLVELRDDRYHFIGRRGGIINVGGQKVYPEEVEAVINGHPKVHMSLVTARRSPITGAIVVADVVLKDLQDQSASHVIENEIRSACRVVLAAHKVPAFIRFASTLPVTRGGKLVRANA